MDKIDLLFIGLIIANAYFIFSSIQQEHDYVYDWNYRDDLASGYLNLSFLYNDEITIQDITFKFYRNMSEGDIIICGEAYENEVVINVDCLNGLASLFQLCNHEVLHILLDMPNEEEHVDWLERAFWSDECVILLDKVAEMISDLNRTA